MAQWLIQNGWVVNEGQSGFLDLRLSGDRIIEIGRQLSAKPGEQVIDAQGRWILPGMIDDQVHFREPGLMHKGDLATESAACVAGGITSFMEMPNTQPVTATRQCLLDKRTRASQKSLANYAFYLGATPQNLEEIRRVDPQLACGIKIFMGSSTGDLVIHDDRVLDAIFADCPLLVVTHCEEDALIRTAFERYHRLYGDAIPAVEHPYIRNRQACFASTEKAIRLARRHGTQLHVLHLTTADELALFDRGDLRQKQITAEVCVHHLWFDESDYTRLGHLIKCNPSIKTAHDREALRLAVQSDLIDIIATDHAPHTWQEKHLPYVKAPSGLPLVQHALLMLLELVHSGTLTLSQVVQKTAHAIAERFQIEDRGYLREGYFADLVMVNPTESTVVTSESLLYKCQWSPLEGTRFTSSIDSTFVNGHRVYHQGAIQSSQKGIPLRFRR
jgi:dihydroorotase